MKIFFDNVLNPLAPTFLVLTFNFGSNIDSRGKKGLVHLVEHCLISSHPFSKNTNFFKWMDTNEINFDAILEKENLFFTFEFKPEKYLLVIDFIKKMFSIKEISKEIFNKEKEIVQGEINQNSLSELNLWRIKQDKIMFNDSPLAYPEIGEIKDIKNIELKDVNLFISDIFSLSNASLVFFNGLTIKERIKSLLSNLKDKKLKIAKKPQQKLNFSLPKEKWVHCPFNFKNKFISINIYVAKTKDPIFDFLSQKFFFYNLQNELFNYLRQEKALIYSLNSIDYFYLTLGGVLRFDLVYNKDFSILKKEIEKFFEVFEFSKKDFSLSQKIILEELEKQPGSFWGILSAKILNYSGRFYKLNDWLLKIKQIDFKDLKNIFKKALDSNLTIVYNG